MAETKGYQILQKLQKQWRVEGFLYCLLLALALSMPIGALLLIAYGSLWWGALVFVSTLALSCWLLPYWRVTLKDITRWLDRTQPELEESSGLLLRSQTELGPLEKLQAARTEQKIAQVSPVRPTHTKLGWAMGLVVLSGILSGFYLLRHSAMRKPREAVATVPVALAEKAAPGVQGVKIRVIPPAYTGRPVRQQENFDIRFEQGATIEWKIETNQKVDHVSFKVNDEDHEQIGLTADDSTMMHWSASLGLPRNLFYQVNVNGHYSDAYKIEMIPDEPPKITIRKPKPYTVIDFGESRKPLLEVGLDDDYGITDAGIVATVASGSGEAVKFKEQTLHFESDFRPGLRNYDLRKILDLDALGMKPGDELYFYCNAKDNHGQDARSDMYIISLPDTAQLMRIEGLTMGLDIKPELFRSERQIIIETEQLLRAKDTISQQAFKDKANSLGIDQKLLRLRYGKFLGEEAEEGDAGQGYAAAGSSPADFSNADKVRDAFTDKHDNSEDATFFEPAVKAQLKATLTEMWNAELRLRTFQVQEALPYEYKALRLLKDLQQKSRAFVAKTGVKTTPLDPKKRLTGQQDAIQLPQRHLTVQTETSDEDILRMTLGILEATPQVPESGPAQGILMQAMRQMGRLASSKPGEYLEGYQAMRRVLDNQSKAGDLALVQRSIRLALPAAGSRPFNQKISPDAGLSGLYFEELKSRKQ